MEEFKFTRRTRKWTILHIILFVLVGLVMTYMFDGGYVLAWYTMLALAIIAIMVLSIPRRMRLQEDQLRIECVMDCVEIKYEDIVSVRAVATYMTRPFCPLFAGLGFFGFYGHFLNLMSLETVQVYAGKWDSFVEITTMYDDKIYVSTDDQELFVESIKAHLKH